MTFTDLRTIHARLQDEISRKLFAARLNVSATGDAGYLTMLPSEYRSLNADTEHFRQKLLSGDRRRTVIFGAGFNGVTIAKEIHMESLAAFIDNYRGGQTECSTGLPIFSMEEYMDQYGAGDTRFVISVSDRSTACEMYAQLVAGGVSPEAVIVIPADYRNSTSQYFDLLIPDARECFVDCGCFDAGTAFRFAGWCGQKGYGKIWCFEPDKASYGVCKELCARLRDCHVYPYGISDRAGTAFFGSGGKECSRIIIPSESETDGSGLENCIETVSLDDFLEGERITFIKMDIEGAELDALQGAAEIIETQKPKLAISVYHKPEDIVEIPKLILGIRPDYKLYIRHYSLLSNETVLYAC